jgi:hypothetical protein
MGPLLPGMQHAEHRHLQPGNAASLVVSAGLVV